ncbi:MAG: hypothetical protein K5790_03295 [Nitrosopumilus sp.]|uniref:hypothetical protein n=1 Tax=Nitrosopumilus sp. TaxID=2024843 RepID=UPI00247C7206|nr:hypothetical protein [Nitrosopumilus sp.]MCV0392303.1 hypothetical protein [Nitrosopumilus sp.]
MGEHEIIVWSKDRKLNWSDFKAESNPAVFEDSHSVIKYRYTWVVNSEKIGDTIMFFIENIQLFVEFHPLLSWVRNSIEQDKLLNHEQGRFDLAELIKQEKISKLCEIFYGKKFPTRGSNEEQRKQFAKEDSGNMIGSEVKKLESEFQSQSNEYDLQTDYGKNIEKQFEFDLTFDKLRK